MRTLFHGSCFSRLIVIHSTQLTHMRPECCHIMRAAAAHGQRKRNLLCRVRVCFVRTGAENWWSINAVCCSSTRGNSSRRPFFLFLKTHPLSPAPSKACAPSYYASRWFYYASRVSRKRKQNSNLSFDKFKSDASHQFCASAAFLLENTCAPCVDSFITSWMGNNKRGDPSCTVVKTLVLEKIW